MVIYLTRYRNNHLYNPNITLNYPEAKTVEQVRYADNEANLLVSVILYQPIIKTAISYVKTFDSNKTNVKHGQHWLKM